MEKIIMFVMVLAAILGISQCSNNREGKWKQTFWGDRNGKVCFKYTMKTKDMTVIRTETYDGGFTYVEYDTLYVKKMAD